MDSRAPIVLSAERRRNRQTCIVLTAFGSVLCILLLAVAVLSWPLIREIYALVVDQSFAFSSTVHPATIDDWG